MPSIFRGWTPRRIASLSCFAIGILFLVLAACHRETVWYIFVSLGFLFTGNTINLIWVLRLRKTITAEAKDEAEKS